MGARVFGGLVRTQRSARRFDFTDCDTRIPGVFTFTRADAATCATRVARAEIADLVRCLFYGGANGGIYDWYEGNFASLFQDSAGTTPVTALEQPVGMIVDSSGRGNHLIQATSTARGVVTGRVNICKRTEEMSSAAWTRAASGTGTIPVVTDNYSTGPGGRPASRVQVDLGGGTTLADQSIVSQVTGAVSSGAAYKGRFYVRATGAGDIGKIISFRHVGGTSYLNITLTADWQLVERLETAAAASCTVGLRGTIGSSTGSVDFQITEFDIRPSIHAVPSIPAYQRVGDVSTTPSDYDSAGFPIGIRLDGGDDRYRSINTIDFSGTDKITYVGGVTKLSDAAGSVLCELSADANTNAGSFYLLAPRSASFNEYLFASRGTSSLVLAGSNSNAYPAPRADVVTCIGDISGDRAIVRVNGAQVVSATGDQGAGNYRNDYLNIGARSNGTTSSSHLNGILYPFTLIGADVGDSGRRLAERWVASRMKGLVTL